MASPSNKKDGRAYLQTLKKEELIDKLMSNRIEYVNLEDEHEKLKKELEELKIKLNKNSIYKTDKEVVKKILSLRAKSYAPTIIFDKLRLEGLEIPLKKIKDIINSELDTEMELYFAKCQQEYIEAIKINTSYLKKSSIEEYQRLIDSAYEDLNNANTEDDVKMRDAIRNSISNLIAKRDNLTKNIDEAGDVSEEEEALNETTENFKETSKNMIRLVVDNVKVIGG